MRVEERKTEEEICFFLFYGNGNSSKAINKEENKKSIVHGMIGEKGLNGEQIYGAGGEWGGTARHSGPV